VKRQGTADSADYTDFDPQKKLIEGGASAFGGATSHRLDDRPAGHKKSM